MKDLFSKPNQITLIRILFIPLFAVFVLMDMPYVAAFIFVVLSLSDALDGYIARKTNQVTEIGKLLDPIADKLLIITAMILLIGKIELWMVILVMIREIGVSVARIFLLTKKIKIDVNQHFIDVL